MIALNHVKSRATQAGAQKRDTRKGFTAAPPARGRRFHGHADGVGPQSCGRLHSRGCQVDGTVALLASLRARTTLGVGW